MNRLCFIIVQLESSCTTPVLPLVRPPQNIVNRGAVKIRQHNQMMRRYFLYSLFILAVLLLRCSQKFSDIRLRQVVILPQISQSFVIEHPSSPEIILSYVAFRVIHIHLIRCIL